MISEPMTLATDYLIALFTIGFGVRLWSRGNRWWAVAFLFTAAASLAGGTYHGFAPVMTPLAGRAFWRATVYCVGLASLFLLSGAPASDTARPYLRALAAVKFAAYAVWMAPRDGFQYVIADYGSSLVILAIIALAAWFRRRDRAAPWILGSIAVSVVAALVQQSGFALHTHFNHNDLYHVIQIVALWMLYRGGLGWDSRTRARRQQGVPGV